MPKSKNLNEAEIPAAITPEIIKPQVNEVQEPVVVEVKPAAVVEPVQVKKGRGNGFKCFCCCGLVLLFCCLFTVGSIYLLMNKSGAVLRFISGSQKTDGMSYLSTANAGKFNIDTYVQTNPPKELGNGKFEMVLTEEVFLELLFSSPENAFLADYVGIDIKEGTFKVQIDLGKLLHDQALLTGGLGMNGIMINTSDLPGTYVNIELTANGDKMTIKSVRLGESALDLATMNKEYFDSLIAELEASEAYKSIETIEFNDGYVRLVMNEALVSPTK